ncbi:fosfomycin resistance glutathione transferase [Anthocerotibacter panamensis]|uniref:fosfomycin resistance glutathione transferase n=1 Tax=Anthocerotibacter panamensis TaxID=2857077 RepID=UPI001C403AA5|nr:fosfomycin resistance glutathione transferase [Anthocerotibacter panamensis]
MITGINHITLATADLERAFDFYVNTLGCRPVARWWRGAYLLAGNLWLCLTLEPLAQDSTYTHLAFNVEAEDYEAFSQTLLAGGVKQWKTNSSEGASLYFLDPDGHKLELHVGNLQTRIEQTKAHPYEDMVFFDNPSWESNGPGWESNNRDW